MTTTTTEEPRLGFAPLNDLATLRCGHLVLMVRVAGSNEDRVCPVCDAEAYAEALRGARVVLRMVRNEPAGSARLRAIGQVHGYTLSHLEHMARTRNVQACRPALDITDTQELKVLP